MYGIKLLVNSGNMQGSVAFDILQVHICIGFDKYFNKVGVVEICGSVDRCGAEQTFSQPLTVNRITIEEKTDSANYRKLKCSILFSYLKNVVDRHFLAQQKTQCL